MAGRVRQEGRGRRGPRGGKQTETSGEKENQGALVRWRSNPPHRTEEMENTIKKKDGTGVLEMDGPVPGNEQGKEPERKNVWLVSADDSGTDKKKQA